MDDLIPTGRFFHNADSQRSLFYVMCWNPMDHFIVKPPLPSIPTGVLLWSPIPTGRIMTKANPYRCAGRKWKDFCKNDPNSLGLDIYCQFQWCTSWKSDSYRWNFDLSSSIGGVRIINGDPSHFVSHMLPAVHRIDLFIFFQNLPRLFTAIATWFNFPNFHISLLTFFAIKYNINITIRIDPQ